MALSLLSVIFVHFALLRHQAEAKSCDGSATYTLTFQAMWTTESHPEDFPSTGGHFSRLVGCSHNGSYQMWNVGSLASKGVDDIAARGQVSKLNDEIDEQIELKYAFHRFLAPGISTGSGKTSTDDVKVTADYPLVSAISMIAPSPDWFVGVHDYSLCDMATGKWFGVKQRDLSLYDAGTDSSKTFVHNNTYKTLLFP